MRTQQLIDALAANLEAADRRAPARATAAGLALGAAVALAAMLIALGPNPALPRYFVLPPFWVKLTFGLALAAASLWAVLRVARPGVRLALAGLAPFVPVAALWLLALLALAGTDAAGRAALVWGASWRTCIVSVPLLALAPLVGALHALRTMAPTRPALAGAAAGGVAGGLAAAIYALHCPELAMPFFAVWYVLGALIPVAIGAVIGSRVLRW